MNVLSVATIFPSKEIPGPGVFIKQRLLALPRDIDLQVLRLRPWFPGFSLLRPSQGVSYPVEETSSALTVFDRRFFYLPGLMKHRDGHFLARGLCKFIATMEKQPDLLDAHFAFPTGFGAVAVGKKLDIPVCITLRGTLSSYANDARRVMLKKTLLGADRIIAVADSLGQLAEEIAGKQLDVRIIGNGVDIQMFRPNQKSSARIALGFDPDDPILLTVGGLVPRKGVHRVLEVLPSVLKKHPRLRYVVVGGGGVEGDFQRQIRQMINELGLSNVVRLVGPVAHENLPSYYAAADLFCLPTSNEGWANVLQESLACGRPVVTTNVGGNQEVVGREENGLVVPFGDRQALEHAILDGLTRNWDPTQISEWGRRRSWLDVGKEVAEVFREIA